MGWLDRKDVTQWMEVANRIYGDSTSMVVHGISMGAATTMMVSGEPQPDYVKCFVEDCGYTSVWDQFSKELKEQFGLPQFPLMYIKRHSHHGKGRIRKIAAFLGIGYYRTMEKVN